MSKDIVSQLKKMKTYNGRINPDHSWVASNRETMMTQISNTVPEIRATFNFDMLWQGMSIFVPTKFVYDVVRPLLVFLVVGAVATSGWIVSVSATEDCLPGDMCYGVKMAVEKTQEIVLSVTGSDEEETQLHLEFASRRATEVKKVVEKKDDTKAPQKAQVAMDKLEKSLQSANVSVKKVGENTPEKIVEMNKEVKIKTDEIKQSLQEAEENSAGVDVSEAKKLAQNTSLLAVEVVLQGKEDGKVVVSDEEVKNLINERFASSHTWVVSLQEKIEELANEVVVRGLSTTSMAIDASLWSKLGRGETAEIQSETTSTDSIDTTMVNTTINEIVVSLEQIIKEKTPGLEEELTSIANLLEENKYFEVINKIRAIEQKIEDLDDLRRGVKQAVSPFKEELSAKEEKLELPNNEGVSTTSEQTAINTPEADITTTTISTSTTSSFTTTGTEPVSTTTTTVSSTVENGGVEIKEE